MCQVVSTTRVDWICGRYDCTYRVYAKVKLEYMEEDKENIFIFTTLQIDQHINIAIIWIWATEW